MEPIRQFKDRKFLLTSEIEGGNAINFRKYPGDIYSFEPKRDPGENYSNQAYYFKFQIENLQKDPQHVTVTAIADYDDVWKGWQFSLNPSLWTFSPNKQILPEKLPRDTIRATPQSMSINLLLQSYQKLIISNMLAFPYSQLLDEIERLAELYPTFLKLTQIGLSPMRNSIYSLKIKSDSETQDNCCKILIAGSPQPNECGDFATLTILQEFLNKGAEFWDDFLSHFSLECIFFQNPDGMILGTNMVNSKGENPFFAWFENTDDMPEENQHIWKYLEKNKPNLYLEMHSFFQDNKTIRPYIYPVDLLSNKKARNLYQKIVKLLIRYCNGMKEEIQLNQPYFRNTLCYKLMERYHIPSIQFKLHSAMNLSQITQTSWDVFTRIIKGIKKG